MLENVDLYALYEDAASIEIAGKTVYLYGLFLALGCALALIALRILTKKRGLPSGFTALYGVIALPLSFILARLVYCFADNSFRSVLSVKNILRVTGGGLAMSGALIGCIAAAAICAKIMKTPFEGVVNAALPAVFLFILFERIGEGFTSLGISRTLNSTVLNQTFLTRDDGFGGDWYLQTWLLEAIAAGILFILTASFKKDAALKGGILFAASQVLFESLRYDQHLMYSFVGVQHILSMLLLAVLVIYAAYRSGRPKKMLWLFLLMMLGLAGALVFIEFKIDRSTINRFLLYGIYVLLLALPAYLGIYFLNKSGGMHHGKGTGRAAE